VTTNGDSQLEGVDIVAGDPITIQLTDLSGVSRWTCRCISTDESQNSDDINAGITINHATRTASLTAPVPTDGCALIFESIVNDQRDLNGRFVPEWRTTFGIFVLTSGGRRVLASGQKTEGDSQFGWTPNINDAIRVLSSGKAGVLGDDTGLASYLLKRTDAGEVVGDSFVISAPKTLTRVVPLVWQEAPITGSPSWSVSTATSGNVVNDVIDLDGQLFVELNLPHGATLTDISISRAGGGIVSDPDPQFPPKYEVVEKDIDTGSMTVLGYTDDPLTSFRGSFSWISVDPGSAVLDYEQNRYFVRVTPETGTDSMVGLMIRALKASYTLPSGYNVGI